MTKRVALMQPSFLPWLGYLELLSEADVFVVLDNFQVVSRSWGTRNRLFVEFGRTDWISVDIDRTHGSRRNFNDTVENHEGRWRSRLSGILTHAYSRSRNVGLAQDLMSSWLNQKYESLADLEVSLLELVRDGLDLDTEIIRASHLQACGEGSRSGRLQTILKKIGADQYLCAAGSLAYMQEDPGWAEFDVRIQGHRAQPYDQSLSDVFVPNLAFIDALANVGWKELPHVVQGTDYWASFSESSEP